MNSINIIGTLTRDIELKYLPSGAAVGTFAIAVNQDYKKQDGTKVEKVSFFDIKMIGKQAEIVNQFFHKGSRIAINGELEQETWTTQDGSNRSRVVIKMKEFSFIDRKSDNQGQKSNINDNQSQGQYNPPEIVYDDNIEEIPF